MSFYSDANTTHFHWKSFALSFVLEIRVFRCQKWRVLIHLIAWWIAGRIGMSGRGLFHAVTVLQHSIKVFYQNGNKERHCLCEVRGKLMLSFCV